MKTQSKEKMPTYQVSGKHLNIFWNEKEVDDGYEYNYCTVLKSMNYSSIVVAIIRSEYSVDDEFSCINDGGTRHSEFLSFREQAKHLAQGWIDQRNFDLLGVQPEKVT